MATSSAKPSFGVIILGNAGVGKSYLCNILMDYERFNEDFRPTSVTLQTENHQLEVSDGTRLNIYNLPGLIEANADRIDSNKREIQKAFAQCPNSIALFVWGHNNGRIQNDDIIAFNALNKAYQFPPRSLAFVVNNLPANRPAQFDGAFIVALADVLASQTYPIHKFIFIDAIDKTSADVLKKRRHARLKLYQLICDHQPARQVQRQEVQLQANELNKLRQQLSKQIEDAAKDRNALLERITQATAQINKLREESEHKIKKLKKRLGKRDKKIKKLTDKLDGSSSSD
ncbi:unnamed protein product [Rotaria magnacalcarata]|uniref:AIG1-type G domain-containing protein n=2 Tax=Rotaria magnacalcarata TaxID=392030 RepID=A0A815DU41_9BILA|nr:unnamed protein product [Rotaria magnacalcarata]CAF2147628.1 unnamed protein product [Rotaria magnacalcarata]CAF3948454.1 unnamed protein product [Rotaria magnacalcarata]CAF3998948.1 unnamed protein product [Rotaria magnacalcarata]CAF4063810.1 unnamed protein product [Rotaria magnacalcarata]